MDKFKELQTEYELKNKARELRNFARLSAATNSIKERLSKFRALKKEISKKDLL